MKDRQSPPVVHVAGIPVVSPLLHLLAIPSVVFLRFNFGLTYFSPKSIFLSLIFTGSIISWILVRSGSQAQWVPQITFFCASSVLYLVHLLFATASQWARKAPHDQYSGTSFLSTLLPEKLRETAVLQIHAIAEPILLVIAAMLVPAGLKLVLLIGGAALALKEWLNAWLILRAQKRDADLVEDAGERAVSSAPVSTQQPLTGTGRTMEAPRPRSSS